MKKKIWGLLLALVMVVTLVPAKVEAAEDKYEIVVNKPDIAPAAELYVYKIPGGGVVTETGASMEFLQGTGWREYTAEANENWVFSGWTYEQIHGGNQLGNRTDWWFGTRYSFSSQGGMKNWYTSYDSVKGKTISVNHLTTDIETSWNPIIYKLYANFNPTITATAGVNGSITPTGTTEVEYGGTQGYTITPNTGYEIEDVKVDGVSVGTDATYVFNNVTAPHTIDVTFKEKVYTITATAGANGNIAPEGATSVKYNGNQSYTITPDTGYEIEDVKVDGESVGKAGTYEFKNVTASHTIDATFKKLKYTITATAGENGSITPDGDKSVEYGSSQEYSITPNAGYVTGEVEVDGELVSATNSYTFENVTANHTIKATFEEDRNNNGIADKDEAKYTVVYTDGVDDEVVFEDQVTTGLLEGDATPAFEGTPARNGYTFEGWDEEVLAPTSVAVRTSVSDTIIGDTVYTAQWKKVEDTQKPTDDKKDNNNNQNGKDNTKKEVKSDIPKTADNANAMAWIITMMGAAVVAVFSLKRRVR